MRSKILLQKIKDEFPKLQWESYKFIEKGWDFDVVILDNRIVFRFPKEKDSIRDLQKEIILLKYLNSRLSVNIPQYLYIAKDKSFAGYNFLNGQEMTLRRFSKLTKNQKKLLAKKIANFLSSLHKTPMTFLKKHNIRKGRDDKFLEWLVNDTKKHVFPKLNKKEKSYVNEHFKELKNSLNDTYKPVLIHGDFTENHILWNGQANSLSIIDFSDHHIGDPVRDFSGLLKYGQKFTKDVFNKYHGSEDKNLLNRAKLNFKTLPLTVMKGALCEDPVAFKDAYKMFKERFKIN